MNKKNNKRVLIILFLLIGIFLGIIISMFLFNNSLPERNQEHEEIISFCQEMNPLHNDAGPLFLNKVDKNMLDVDGLGELQCFTRYSDGTISPTSYYTIKVLKQT